MQLLNGVACNESRAFGFPSPAVLGSDNTTTVSSGDKLLRITTFNPSGNWTKQSDAR